MSNPLKYKTNFNLGIEFWSNVCDEEVDLEIERSEAEELGKPPENVSRFYAKVRICYAIFHNKCCLVII